MCVLGVRVSMEIKVGEWAYVQGGCSKVPAYQTSYRVHVLSVHTCIVLYIHIHTFLYISTNRRLQMSDEVSL